MDLLWGIFDHEFIRGVFHYDLALYQEAFCMKVSCSIKAQCLLRDNDKTSLFQEHASVLITITINHCG